MGSPKGGRSNAPVSALREAREWAKEHQRVVGTAWDDTLRLVNAVDFQAISSKDTLRRLRRAVRRWHDLTLEPVVRLAPIAERAGSVRPPDDPRAYLSRVLVGMGIDEYDAMCDGLDTELEASLLATGPLARLDWRDRLVELMEIGVRTLVSTMEWAEGKLRAEGRTV